MSTRQSEKFEEFKNPGKEYRPSPFWAWNNGLTNEELRWQVCEMKKQGFGGYFMHARTGLKIEYLGSEWMDRIANVLDEGKKQDMESWLYDEDQWPSGFAGGMVTESGEAYRAKYLKKSHINKSDIPECMGEKETLAVFALDFQNGRLKEITRIERLSDVEGLVGRDVDFCVFRVVTEKCTNRYNGQAYADILCPEAVMKFIELTYENYRNHFGTDFGEYMPGVFTDEPNYRNPSDVTAPWTAGFEKYFQEINGYDLIGNLPALFYCFKDWRKVRYDFFYAITKRFIESFTKPLYEFCEANKLKLTGHYLHEDTMLRQTRYIGAAMPHYEFMQIPGIDHLCRNIKDPLTLKQCSSAAHQFARNRILCENFGAAGHSMSFEDQKWIADFNFALGITFTCQHLVLYSMVGNRKRDYPPTFSYHQPYWEDYFRMNDYLARAGWFCSQGDFIADILVLHPVGSVWAIFEGEKTDEKYDRGLAELQDILLSSNFFFDYGDEVIMEKNAGIIEGGQIRIGKKGRYGTVIVPPSLTWSENTFKLLDDFSRHGGEILFVGELPELISGVHAAQKWEDLFGRKSVHKAENTFEDIVPVLENLLQDKIKIRDEKGEYIKDIYVHARKDAESYHVFLCNKNRHTSFNAEIVLPFIGKVSELNLQTGESSDIGVDIAEGAMYLKSEFVPAGSRAYLVDVAGEPKTHKKKPLKTSCVIPVSDSWNFDRAHKNVLTLDYCRYSIDSGEKWSEKMPLWKVRHRMLNESGLEEYDRIQPWVMEQKGVKPKKKINLRLLFEFNSEIQTDDINIVIEKAANWKLRVNGRKKSTDTGNFLWDKQFGMIDISGLVSVGGNIIELECDYCLETEVEDIYLAGEFGIRRSGYIDYTITEEPEVLKNGSWVYQGYPFYSGNMIYKANIKLEQAKGKKYFIRLNNPKGILYKIRVNRGKTISLIARPWEVDITGDCVQGENLVEIEVVGSLRNTFGPLHHRLQVPFWTGPFEFIDEANWVDAYQFEDFGLVGGAEIIIKE